MQSLLYLALSNAVLATLLAVFAAIIARLCRRPSVRHALWLLVLLKLITPSLVPLPVTWPRSDESEPSPADVLPPAPVPSEPIPSLLDSIPSIGAATVRERLDAPLPYGRGSDLSLALVLVWLGGSVAWWSVAAVRLRRFRRLLRQARPASADVQEQGRRLAALLGLRRCPPIVFVSAPLSPLLWALGFSPRLLVPSELWRKLTAEQQDTLLAHELAHLRRGDHWVRRLEFLVLGLYWWHPVVWWARRRLQEAEEECCDALVVAVLPDAAPAYAAALVETVAFLSQSRSAALVGASGAGHVPLLKRRLTMILSETSIRKPSRIGFWIVLGLGALLLPLAPRAARTEALEEPQPLAPVALDFGFPVITDALVPPAIAKNPHMKKALQMANCAVCHVSPNDKPHNLPHPWREIHGELVRLTEEYARELHKAVPNSPSADDRNRADEIEKLQDEIELLKAQVRLKERRVEATEKPLKEYRSRLETYQRINQRQPSSIPTDTLSQVRLAIITHEGQLQVNEAELQESMIRLKQTERRLARFQPAKNEWQLAPKTAWNITWAEALFAERSHDLGRVRQGAIVERRFALTNHGQRPVHIASIRTSAGCLEATISRDELPPGGSAAIQTRLDTSRFSGSKTFKIHVQFDKPDRQEVILEIHADSRTEAPAKPQSPDRLQDLEKKLDELRKEMDKLRRDMRSDKPRDPILLPDRSQR